MASKNKFGLLRNIPADISRYVRQRCGFGCVVCGDSIIQYEHIEPVFAEAKIHDMEKIALLCGGCHDKVTRGFLSKQGVLRALDNPKCKQEGFSRGVFDPAFTHPTIHIAGSTFKECWFPLTVDDNPVFSIEGPEASGGPFRLSATFYDEQEKIALQILRNEWQLSSGSWDVEATGGRIIVRSAPGKISLQLRFLPSQGIVVERLNMHYKNVTLDGNEKRLRVKSPIMDIQFAQTQFSNTTNGIHLSSHGFSIG
jgi:hypothetical protein